jgi:hypothetical protein
MGAILKNVVSSNYEISTGVVAVWRLGAFPESALLKLFKFARLRKFFQEFWFEVSHH